jgi:probable HAF family extracellular repeat protein
MKFTTFTSITGTALLAVLATPAPAGAQEPQHKSEAFQHYRVQDLGTLGAPFSQAAFVGDDGVVTGVSALADGAQHAVVWRGGKIKDIGVPGLGGPNNYAGPANARGQVLVQAETAETDPNSENFCGYGTGFTCRAALWHDGGMTALPTLGGYNSSFGGINNRGEAAGYAETSVTDPDCPAEAAVNGTGPLALRFEAVIWGPKRGEIRRLSPLRGDSVGIAFWINDQGQAAGISGSCANTIIPPFAAGPHAVLWEEDGSPIPLGDLGGTVNTAVLGVGNVAFGINNRGEVAGLAAVPDSDGISRTNHAVLWTRDRTKPLDLGTLSEDDMSQDDNSAGLAINDQGDVVGASTKGDITTGSSRAFLWRNGVMTDLNSLAPDSPIYLLVAYSINNGGEIAGFGVDTSTGEIHGFLAAPDRNHNEAECCGSAGRRKPTLSRDAGDLFLRQPWRGKR